MTIQYYTKNVYGNELAYIADKGQAGLWEYLTGRKTINTGDMARLERLTGVEFERVFEPVEAR